MKNLRTETAWGMGEGEEEEKGRRRRANRSLSGSFCVFERGGGRVGQKNTPSWASPLSNCKKTTHPPPEKRKKDEKIRDGVAIVTLRGGDAKMGCPNLLISALNG